MSQHWDSAGTVHEFTSKTEFWKKKQKKKKNPVTFDRAKYAGKRRWRARGRRSPRRRRRRHPFCAAAPAPPRSSSSSCCYSSSSSPIAPSPPATPISDPLASSSRWAIRFPWFLLLRSLLGSLIRDLGVSIGFMGLDLSEVRVSSFQWFVWQEMRL